MFDVLLTFESGARRVIRVQSPLTIGRSADCGVRIASWRVSRHHARLSASGPVVELEDLGSLMGTWVNGRRVNVHHPVQPDDEITIGPCRIRIRQVDSVDLGRSNLNPAPAQVSEPVMPISKPGEASAVQGDLQPLTAIPALPSRAALIRGQASACRAAVVKPSAMGDESSLCRMSSSNAGEPKLKPEPEADAASCRQRLHEGLRIALDLRRRDVAGMSDDALRNEVQAILERISTSDIEIPASLDRESLCREVLDEALGLGPLEPLLADPSISEIMVNRYDEIYIERNGSLMRHDAFFSSEQAVRWVIERVVAPIGRRIDENSPMVDARLSDGSRVNAVIPPIALKGANLTIRKFPAQRLRMDNLIQCGAISKEMAEFLRLCVRTRKNLVVSGGTGSGKTTLLNILSNGIPEGERVVTIEDAAELRLDHAHLVALEARPANLEQSGRIDIRDLVRNALRMRPDRIVVGECRGAEAFDMLTAMNTGHEGSLTTLHANSPRDALRRLEAMVLMADVELPLSVVREHIVASVDIVVQQARLPNGRRVVLSITEITGLESGRIQSQELFSYHPLEGFRGCGLLPSFIDEWQAAGIEFDLGGFGPGSTDRSSMVQHRQ